MPDATRAHEQALTPGFRECCTRRRWQAGAGLRQRVGRESPALDGSCAQHPGYRRGPERSRTTGERLRRAIVTVTSPGPDGDGAVLLLTRCRTGPRHSERGCAVRRAGCPHPNAPYVPYCGLAVLEELSGVRTACQDPFLPIVAGQGGQDLAEHQDRVIAAAELLLPGVPTP